MASPTTSGPAITVAGLVKSFGEVRALDGLDLTAQAGTVLGLLGPNGAGKTTAVRVLTTLLKPDAGMVRVAGFDVVRQAAELREHIGLAGQYAAVDENLTGLENLTMVGRLYGRRRAEARGRGQELLARFDLVDAAGRPAKTYSGGMRRRLDLAAALVARPPVLFLAEGTSDELKDRVGGERLEVRLADAAQAPAATGALAPMSDEAPAVDDDLVRIAVRRRSGTIVDAVRRLDDAGVDVDDLALRRPTLDDVFLTLTGHAAEAADSAEAAGRDDRESEEQAA